MAKGKKYSSLFVILLGSVLLLGLVGIFLTWKYVLAPNINTVQGNFIYVRTGWKMDDLVKELEGKGVLKDKKAFLWLADMKGFDTVIPGRYRISKGMSNNNLVNILKAGLQEEVEFTFNGLRTKEHLVRRVGLRLEADSTELENMLSDNDFLSRYGMTENNISTMIIAKKYKFKWNTSAQQFLDTMAASYKRVWTEDRQRQARELGMTQAEVVTLASIVEQEQPFHPDEKPTVAGLYHNRLKKGMRLQSDPTVIFAIGDFSIQRVSREDLKYRSPYNTYLNAGLPPGPICFPSLSSIDAVLNPSRHNYIYMCAKADNSGRHHFTDNWEDHKLYAESYHSSLDERNIHR